MFGRQATLPIDVELQKASPDEVCQKFHTLDELNTSAILREHAQRLETAKQNILVAQLKQKENYDQKHAKPEWFQVNQDQRGQVEGALSGAIHNHKSPSSWNV